MFSRAVVGLALGALAVAGPATVLANFSNTTISAAQVDVSGNIYIAGYTGTASTYHAFVAKLSPSGSTIYSMNFKGNGSESASAIAVDATGAAYVYGQTSSPDFPVTAGALQTTLPSGGLLGFVVRLDPQGKVVYSTFLGDSSRIDPGAMLLDSAGNLFLSGKSIGAFPSSTLDFASYVGADFVVKLNSAGSAITGAIRGAGGLLAADPLGNIYIAGVDESDGAPITPGAFQSKYTLNGCGGDAQVGIGCSYQYVTKLNSGLTQIAYSTYVAGSHGASPAGINVDARGDAFLVGTTNSPDYPTTPNSFEPTYVAKALPPPQTCLFFCVFPPPASGFVTELNPTGTGLVYSSFFSGSLTDSISFAAFTANGIYLAGQAGSADLPGLNDFAQQCLPATFVTLLNPTATSAGATRILSGVPNTGVLAFDPTTATLIAWSGSSLIRFDPTAPLTPISCVLDAADLGTVSSIAPGELLTIFGPNLAGDVETNGIAAPLLYVSPQQINLQAPYEIAGASEVNVALTSSPGGPDLRTLGVVASNPVVFLDTVTQVSSLPATCLANIYLTVPVIPMAFNADGSRNTCGNPVPQGSVVTLYLAGPGETSPAPVTGGVTPGPPIALNLPITVKGGATFVSAESTVGWISGVWQLNLNVGVGYSGAFLVTITVGGVPVRDTPLIFWVK